MKVIQKFALVVALLASPAALPCSFDTDCDPGSKCLKRSGSIDGVCAGGISPGNRSDRQPVKAPLTSIEPMATPARSIPTAVPVPSAKNRRESTACVSNVDAQQGAPADRLASTSLRQDGG